MYVAVLIADPKHCPLDPDALTALRTAWAGSEARWLAPGTAAELALEAIPGNRWHMWEVLQREGIDLCIVPAANRQKRLLIADMDSTMIAQECIDELAEVAGIGARVKEITARAMNGELDFEAALRARVALLKGLEVSVIDDVLATRITEAPGGRALLRTMKAGGATTLLVSGGFTAFSSVVAARIGFDR
ncbi:MAG: HAD-IB family phosphatase, partial [Pseudomonadota bacterium]